MVMGSVLLSLCRGARIIVKDVTTPRHGSLISENKLVIRPFLT